MGGTGFAQFLPFTVIVYFMESLLPFRYEWIGNLIHELATLAFFVMTGYVWRRACLVRC